jgi:hypothetical protein
MNSCPPQNLNLIPRAELSDIPAKDKQALAELLGTCDISKGGSKKTKSRRRRRSYRGGEKRITAGHIRATVYIILAALLSVNMWKNVDVIREGLQMLFENKCGQDLVGNVSNFFGNIVGLNNVAYNPVCKVYQNALYTVERVMYNDPTVLTMIAKTLGTTGGLIACVDKVSEVIENALPFNERPMLVENGANGANGARASSSVGLPPAGSPPTSPPAPIAPLQLTNEPSATFYPDFKEDREDRIGHRGGRSKKMHRSKKSKTSKKRAQTKRTNKNAKKPTRKHKKSRTIFDMLFR